MKKPLGQLFPTGAGVAAMSMGINRPMPGDKNKAQRGVFMAELHDLLTKFEKTVVEELSEWLKSNQDSLPDAVYEKLEAQVSLHAQKGTGWGGLSSESRRFAEELTKFIKKKYPTQFKAAYGEIQEWMQSCEQLSAKLSVLEAQDTSGLFASVTALTGEKATLEAELKAARDLIARLEKEKKEEKDLLARLEEEKKEEKKQLNERLLEQSQLAQKATGLQAEVDGYKREIVSLQATLEHFKKEDSKKTDNTSQLVAVAKYTQEKLDVVQTQLEDSRIEIINLSRASGLDDSKISKSKIPPAAEPKKSGVNTTSDPVKFLAPRDTVLVNGGGNGQLQRRSTKGATGAQPPQAAFFSQQPSQQPPAPDLLKLEQVFLPVSEKENTNKEKILKCIQKTTTYNVVSPIRLKALVALGRFLSALPAIDETDSVCKFALDSVKKLASHENGSPNSPSQCLKDILEYELSSVTVTPQQAPSFDHLKAELTALSKEPARNSIAENLKDIRLLQGWGVLFHNDVGFNVPLLKEHFKAEKAKYTIVASNASDRSQDVSELQRSNLFGSEGTGPDSFNY